MTLLAVFQVLLSRYSGQEDIVVGSSIAGRTYAEIEPLIGFFVNTLPLRANLSGSPTFRELLARVKQVALDGYAHQELPFEKLVEELQPERSLSYNPIFQVLFGLQNMPRRYFEASGLSVERSSIHQSTSILDMSWFAYPTPDGMLLRVEYDTDLFDGTTIDRMLRHYEQLLRGVLENPDQRISQLPLLTDEERHQVLMEWNATSTEYPRDSCVHELIARQARRSPDRVAVECVGRTLTYAELNARSNQLARYLQRRGVGSQTLVALMVDRSPEMLVAILGILKAGGAYLPLDPMHPRDRSGFIVQDAGVSILVTESSLADAAPQSSAELIHLDTVWPDVGAESEEDLPPTAKPDHLAYVLYTSGSTGRPKGVQIEHRNLTNFLTTMQVKPGISSDDVLLAVTTLSFDIAGLEMYLPLISGARVVLATREQALDAAELIRLLAELPVTIMQATPATWRMLIEIGWTGDPSLKILCGGEAFPADLANQLRPRCGELWNMYGPTETTIWSSVYLIDRELTQLASIGKPIANTTMYVLDAHSQPTPVGVRGELYIGGDGVARGYLNRPELTAERFRPDPFRSGERIYRTGDLAYYQPDGNIQFLGRADFQVKLRGFRIELGEIEAELAKCRGIEQAVVAVREDRPGDKRLVAYFIARAGEEPSLADLGGQLSVSLPEYMVPGVFMRIDSMPLTPNGKINRLALPVPEISRDEAEAFVGPRDPVEQKLAEIWAEVLHVPEMSVHDNFFRLGGHSLLATQVVSRVRKAADVEIPLRYMFEWPTIAELASKIEEARASKADVLPPIQRASRDQSIPLSYAQRRLWFLNQLDPDSPLYNVPLTIRLSGALHVDALRRALNEIIRRHEALRTSYQIRDDAPVQVIANEVKIEVPIQDYTGLPVDAQERTIRRIAVESGKQVFDLQVAPVLRASLLKIRRSRPRPNIEHPPYRE